MYIKGIDISHYQRFDNYAAFDQGQLGFVFIKATERIYKDCDFINHREGTKATCLLRGATFTAFQASVIHNGMPTENSIAPKH
jgi:GH25 family lysozyme M1 (1,4-beta-N-acetylmuramidase)